MLSSPVYYHRQYGQDIPRCQSHPKVEKAQRILAAAFPILTFFVHTPPVSVTLGGLRSISHLQTLAAAIQKKNASEISMAVFHLLLSLAAVVLVITAIATPYLNPSIGLLVFGIDDVIGNLSAIVKSTQQKDDPKLLENIAHLMVSLLYITFISIGHIEILATCMLLQILTGYGQAVQAFQRGDYLEGLCHLTSSALILTRVAPQLRIIDWKWRRQPKLEGELCRDSRGFVYLKIDDKLLFELNTLFPETAIPPYFGPGKAGAHVTVIPVGELSQDIPMPELGKKVSFNIASYDSLKPFGWKGVDSVSFIALGAPDLNALRSKYLLPSKVHGSHDFHMTFGVTYA